MNSDRVREYLKQRNAIDEAETAIKEQKAALTALAKDIVTDFDVNGIQNAKVDGMVVYLSHELFCNIPSGSKSLVVAWAKENGLGDAVKEEIATATIKSYIRECIGEEKDLTLIPPALAANVKVYEEIGLRVKAG